MITKFNQFFMNESIILDDWSIRENKLVAYFDFSCDESKNKFLEEVEKISKKMKHDPVITPEGGNKVKLEVWTHSIGGITKKDFDLAKKISSVDRD